MSKDYYAILGVQKNASQDEIKKAFRRLAHEHHPDKGGDSAKFKDINEAYQVLGDDKKRGMYDQYGSGVFEQGGAGGPGGPGFGGFGGFDVNFNGFDGDLGDLGDVLGEMFGFGGRHARQAHGKDIEVDVELTLKEAAFGVDRELRLYKDATCSHCHGNGAESGTKLETCATCQGSGKMRRAQRTMLGTIQTVVTCETCQGRGQKPEKVCTKCKGTGVERLDQRLGVQIPGGLDTGEAIKVPGQGEAAPYGGKTGDLYVRIRVKSDPRFTREGNNVVSTVSVPYSTLVLGGSIETETLDGTATVKIPEATNPGTVITLRGKGIPYIRSHGRGDQLVRITTEAPKKPTREQRDALDQLKRAGL